MKFKLYATLFYVFFLSGCSNSSYVNAKQNKASDISIKLVYELKDIMANEIAFIHGTTKVVINRSVEALIVDYTNNKIVKIIPSPNSEDFIKTIKVSEKNNKLLVSTSTEAQVWDINKLKLINSFSGKKNSRINGLSFNGRLLIFNEQIFNVKTTKIVMKFNHDVSPFSYEFSRDARYLVIDGHNSGASIIDIKSQKQTGFIKEKGMQKVRFTKNNLFYAGYGGKLLPEAGGYYPASIGLYNVINRKRENEYTPPNRISCWVKMSDDNILAALVNGSIELLDKQLKVIKSWRLDDKITICAVGKSNQVWLGSKKTGVYLLDTSDSDIVSVITSVSDVAQIALSADNQYLGIVKSIPDGSHINIYSITE